MFKAFHQECKAGQELSVIEIEDKISILYCSVVVTEKIATNKENADYFQLQH
jgi:hypothetical protein